MNPLSLKIGITLIVTLLLSLGAYQWYSDNIDEAELKGAKGQVVKINDATDKLAEEGEQNAEDIKTNVDAKPIDDIGSLLDTLPTVAEPSSAANDGSSPAMPSRMEATTDDPIRRSEAEDDEPSDSEGDNQQRTPTKAMGKELREESSCPDMIQWNEELQMNVTIECKLL